MTHCMECGELLTEKYLEKEGTIPYCPRCEAFRFPMYNVAVSMEVLNPAKDKVLLIKQYGRGFNVLVAGYVNKGEAAEHAVAREVKEEIGLNVGEISFNMSEYFAPSNTLMVNFSCVAEGEDLSGTNEEIDSAAWYSLEEAKTAIKPGSLAEKFLLHYLAGRC